MDKKPAAAGKSSFDLIDPEEFFARIDLWPGARVLDLGCGAGRYSIEIAKALGGTGQVYAVDSWDEGIESLRKTIRKEAISNLRPILADIAERLPLGDASVDLCLMATVLHDIAPQYQASALAEVARVLRPGGVLALVEFKKVDRGPGPPISIRISEPEAETMVERYGLRMEHCGDLGEFTYLLTARKPHGSAEGRG